MGASWADAYGAGYYRRGNVFAPEPGCVAVQGVSGAGFPRVPVWVGRARTLAGFVTLAAFSGVLVASALLLAWGLAP